MTVADLAVVTGYAGLDQPSPGPLEPGGSAGSTRHQLVLSAAAVSMLLLLVTVAAVVRFGSPPPVAGPGAGVVPTVAISSPGASGRLIDGAPVRVDARDGGATVRIDLFVDGDWVGSDSAPPYTPPWEHRSAGRHELKAKVTDAEGNVRYSDPVRVRIEG